ncbi:DUF2147 domain-containing protein [Hyphomicrobium sp.]|uniref:DUF2147 domain-containing protein n=1 Tax=Hyphomicrobium sp. TaxID=82 RepID=UPI002E3791E1|nr:DUF2147 domain-containing protein [Hyphomicrobium sp.]HEX2843500.1 DUF2147 domain-containing protein [Hyphomicrobium sp.]
MPLTPRTLTLAAAGLIIWAAPSHAASDPSGIWFDHNGRGAVEIAPCASGNGLCGYVVHIKDPKNNKRCGTQILGNVTPGGGGWIYSPDRGKKYSVELTRLSDDKLRVVGNAGSFFSKTFTWNRAPDDVARCGETTAAAPAKPTEAKAVEATAEPATTRENTAEPVTVTSSTGASNASLALMGAPKKQKREVVQTAAKSDEAAAAAPAVAKEPAPSKPKAAPQKTAEAPAPAEEESFVPERKCKFKIPYVGRVISVPCRD